MERVRGCWRCATAAIEGRIINQAASKEGTAKELMPFQKGKCSGPRLTERRGRFPVIASCPGRRRRRRSAAFYGRKIKTQRFVSNADPIGGRFDCAAEVKRCLRERVHSSPARARDGPLSAPGSSVAGCSGRLPLSRAPGESVSSRRSDPPLEIDGRPFECLAQLFRTRAQEPARLVSARALTANSKTSVNFKKVRDEILLRSAVSLSVESTLVKV